MAKVKFADFKSQTRISDEDFDLFESVGKVRLSTEQRIAIGNALREYEFLRVLKETGEGAALKHALQTLQARTERFIESIQAVRNEPRHIWEYLLAESGAEISGLHLLLAKCKELNKQVARKGRKRDFFFESLLSKLADIFQQAKGRGTSVSKSAGGKGSRFLSFAYAATNCLPETFRSHSKGALSTRLDRLRKAEKKEKGRVHMWVGGAHPSSAKPWFGKAKL
jgi:hypothetical protein